MPSFVARAQGVTSMLAASAPALLQERPLPPHRQIWLRNWIGLESVTAVLSGADAARGNSEAPGQEAGWIAELFLEHLRRSLDDPRENGAELASRISHAIASADYVARGGRRRTELAMRHRAGHVLPAPPAYVGGAGSRVFELAPFGPQPSVAAAFKAYLDAGRRRRPGPAAESHSSPPLLGQ